ncbi:KTSC domain-containing protein [Halorussus sp. AFM4]|uniref:KTSC domain-containing protein n=1 Tax=Halorussus sp. AFM4 TaxID=3421651 RepID=UPI003EBCD341
MKLPAPINHDPSNERPAPTEDELDIRAPLDTMPASSFQSSNVHSALYDYGEAQLYIRYLRDGQDAIYEYWGVPASTWDGLLKAASKGSFINANIAQSYTYSKLSASSFPQRGHGLNNDLARRFVTTP